MSAQDHTARLCQEADHHLSQGKMALATAFYMAAFSCNAPTAVKKVKSLGRKQWEEVIATLESWCLGDSAIPKLMLKGISVVSLNTGIAVVFLSTLCPNNFAASICRMETLLRSGRYEEVVSRCNTLLNTHSQHSVQLLLTRGLAWVLSQTRSGNGVVDYMQVFGKQREATIKFVCSKQKEYLPQITRAIYSYISSHDKDSSTRCLDALINDCHNFLIAIMPDDPRAYKMQAAFLLEKCKFEECVVFTSKAIETLSTRTDLNVESLSCLLLDQAAAFFSLGGRTKDMLQDLKEAFSLSPSHAKEHFDQLFSPQNTERVEANVKATMEMEFAEFREALRAHPELRSNPGTDLLSPIIWTLQFLIHISPSAKREMSIRLADCQLLAGDFRSCLEICNHLLESEPKTYQNTLLVLRGFSHLHVNEHQQALEDFQKIIEHDSPHPSSCVKALCGRGLIRMLGSSPYLTALDYITACRLKMEETFLTIKSYVPWNQRGLLYKVLQEEGQKMLQKKPTNLSASVSLQRKKAFDRKDLSSKDSELSGLHQLASLLMELDPTDEVSRILCTDVLYQMHRVEEAHKMLLLALNGNPQRSPVLARLALLQLKKGFIYDGNQLIKKVIQIGDTSCLLPIMDIFREADRKLMQSHCHSRAMAILKSKQGDTYVKEAVAYLSLAIIASGGNAEDSLLARAQCYGHLGQKKTALFDFNAILKENPGNVKALCGRSFLYLLLNQQKEAVQDMALALKLDASSAIQDILCLKQEALISLTQWLHDHCRTVLNDLLTASKDPVKDETFKDLLAIGRSLTKINDKTPSWHILYVDTLIASGRYEDAHSHLLESFSHNITDESVKARHGIILVKRQNTTMAAHDLGPLAGKGPKELEFLMKLLENKQRQSLSQVASQEGNDLSKRRQPEKALNYYSLAVLASNNNPRFLRQRAVCLSHLQEYSRALKDLDKAIQRHGSSDLRTQVEDYCSKGYLLLAMTEEEAAVRQYIKALRLEPSMALASIRNRPGKISLGQNFYQIAQGYLEHHRYEDAWNVTDYGLVIDENSNELKKLKAKIRREASGCIVH
ncbi:tetratricopeptide repeat protein 34 [Microcaecilia unicolor]|uniref:Tetratricopeptide repeat protein 34 n=1 Tax=Microcaecilia unicolor TaxID=1415580 RepID=A0A6P7ZVD2_9AMPH|nr:tetratricopeptide repeat protein 34 [Microcaecilia unicolor]